MKTNLAILAILMVFFLSCEVIESVISPNKLGGEQSTIGAVDNTFSVYNVNELGGLSAKVTALENGVSSVTVSTTITDPKVVTMAKAIPDLTWNGNKVSVTRKYKITTEGIQSIHDEGNLMMVKYDAKVGDSYSLKINGNTVKRTVTERSTDDDYPYAFFMIKVIKVEETGRGIPGVSRLEYFLNHKFGLVGINVVFEDGSSRKISIISKNDNS